MRTYKFTCYFVLLSEKENQIGVGSNITDMAISKITTQANSYKVARLQALDHAHAWLKDPERDGAQWFMRLCLSEEDRAFNENPISV